jgi:hypothetical protein
MLINDSNSCGSGVAYACGENAATLRLLEILDGFSTLMAWRVTSARRTSEELCNTNSECVPCIVMLAARSSLDKY